MGETTSGLPAITRVSATAPLRWLSGAWSDLGKSPVPCLLYGLILSIFSIWLAVEIYTTNAAYWVFMVTCGFVFVAPILAMGLYEAGRLIEAGERPSFANLLLPRSALRQDIAYLGLMLLLIFLFWLGIAQIVYGLSTYQIHRNAVDLVRFAVGTQDGRGMLVLGTAIGGLIAFLTFSLVVVSAPMLLDRNGNAFIAVITSVRAVTQNFAAMAVWAVIIVISLLACVATGFVGLIVVFPLLGLASWRAYRDVVREDTAAVSAAPTVRLGQA